jgi:PAS domain S-box-containing protein
MIHMRREPIRILLVATDPLAIEQTKSLVIGLSQGEFVMEVAPGLAEGLERLMAGGVGLVLIDLNLPECRELDAVIKVRHCAPSIPVVVLASPDEEKIASQALQRGACGCLVKGRMNWQALVRAVLCANSRALIDPVLAEEHRRLAFLLDNIPDRVFFKDEKSRFLEVNLSLANRFMLDNAEQAIGKTDFDLFTREHAASAVKDEEEVMRTGRPIIAKVEQETLRDGRIFWALTTKMPLRDENGRIVGTFGISHDITELKRAELAVRDSEERYNRLLDSVADYVYTVEMDRGTVLSTNHGHGCIAVTGYTADEFKSDSTLWYRIIHPDDRQSVITNVQTIIETALPVSIEHRIIRKDGSIRWVRNKQAPRHDAAGQLTAYDGLISDISERKHAEDLLREANARLREVLGDLTNSHEELKATQLQLIQMEKSQLASELAAGVAHEVKNPLAILQMGIQFFADQPMIDRETANSVLHEMREAVERANSVIEDLLIFSSSRELTMHESSVTSLMEETLRLIRPALAMSGIKVVTDLDSNLPACRMDSSRIGQVFANVISNASHAMPSGGTLTISAVGKTLGGGDVNFEQGDRSGRRLRQGDMAVVIEIRDTGTGIPVDKLSRVFDPFFTTKKTGSGKGLGLSVSKKIIDLHEGEISIVNMPDGGSKVTIVLPNAALRDDA